MRLTCVFFAPLHAAERTHSQLLGAWRACCNMLCLSPRRDLIHGGMNPLYHRVSVAKVCRVVLSMK